MISYPTVKAQTKIIVPVDYPIITGMVPPDSNTFPPLISITTPLNSTVYTTNRLPLIFNVTAPESKTAASTIVQNVKYTADWMNKTIEVFSASEKQVSFSLQLGDIPEGNHSIVIQALGDGLYAEGSTYKEFKISSSSEIRFVIDATSPTISPTANPILTNLPTPSPSVPEFSWLAALPVLLSVFTVAVIVRHRKTANIKGKVRIEASSLLLLCRIHSLALR
jgi:hypothetical protein